MFSGYKTCSCCSYSSVRFLRCFFCSLWFSFLLLLLRYFLIVFLPIALAFQIPLPCILCYRFVTESASLILFLHSWICFCSCFSFICGLFLLFSYVLFLFSLSVAFLFFSETRTILTRKKKTRNDNARAERKLPQLYRVCSESKQGNEIIAIQEERKEKERKQVEIHC